MAEFFSERHLVKRESRTHTTFLQRFNTGILAHMTKTGLTFDVKNKKTRRLVLYFFQLSYLSFFGKEPIFEKQTQGQVLLLKDIQFFLVCMSALRSPII